MKEILKKVTGKGLIMLEKRAERKANAECMGFVYEPKVPKKLKKTVCMGLACVMAIVGVLASSVGMYEAAVDYECDSWNIMVTSPGTTDREEDITLYLSDKYYNWKVSAASNGSGGYGYVYLDGVNNTVVMKDGLENKMNDTGNKYFYITNIDISSSLYAKFKITAYVETYVTHYTGTVEITTLTVD